MNFFAEHNMQAQKYGDKVACSYRDVVDIVEEKKAVQKADGSGEEQKLWK